VLRATKFRKVGGGGAAWYASKNEAVGLGRDAPSSSNGIVPTRNSLLDLRIRKIARCVVARRSRHSVPTPPHATDVCTYNLAMRRKSHGPVPHRRSEPGRIGLARALSKMGVCSRSQAAELIRAGRVRLNGAVKRNPETPVKLGVDRIEVDGGQVAEAPKIYLMLNKPRGVVTTASDEKGRTTVYDVLRQQQTAGVGRDAGFLAPVGRLDKASEGLLLFTNDSEWAARVLAPETHLDKTYHVHVACAECGQLLASLRNGVTSEGEVLRVKRADVLRSGEKNCWLEIVLDEGRNRHIRRMLEALRVEVLRIVRVAIGTLELGDLAKSLSRTVSREEKARLDQAMNQRSRNS
jgi:23S rRNA pseudouridine2605 synthase